MFNKTDNAISYKGKLVFLRILYITSEIQQNTKRSYGYLQKIVTLADSNAELIQNFTGPYIHSLSNLILFQISMYKFKEAEINIAKLKNLRKGFELNISTESTVFYYTYLLQMALYIETIQLDKGIELIAEIESKLNIYKDNIIKYRVMQFYFFFADLNFLKGNYDKSLEWLNKILNREPSEVSPETLCFSRVLRLLIHYEKNNYDLVESLANSTKRSIKRQQNPYQFEKLVTEFMLEAIKLKNDKDTKYTLMRLKKELQKLFIYDYEKNAIENLGLITWIKSKTSNKPLIEILQQELDQKLNIRK
jgi:tetratricopeptide (TPR) repeat protein